MDRPVTFGQARERPEDGLVLVIDGIPSTFGHVVQVDFVVGDENGSQVGEFVHFPMRFSFRPGVLKLSERGGKVS